MLRSRKVAIAVCTLLIFGSSLKADNLVETAVKAGNFKTLVAAVKAAGLVDTLAGNSQLTVFAPTDEAFAKLPQGTVETLLKPENKSQLISILTFHVVPGRVMAKDAFKVNFAGTANGQRLDIAKKDGKLTINGSALVATDIQCDNGVIHVIDAVMLPESDRIPAVATKAKSFNTLLAAAKAAGLASVLDSDGPFTVFAPTDAAFAKLPKGTVETLLKPENKDQLVAILKYHVIAGRVFSDQAVEAQSAATLLKRKVTISVTADGAKVNDAKLVATDIEAANGVIHVIDSVLLPPAMTKAAVRKMLEITVSNGSKIYNAGNVSQCAKLYRSAMNEVIDGADASVSKSTLDILRLSLERSRMAENHGDPCWVLRHGIDLAYFSLDK